MKILSIRLIAVELTQSLKVYTDTKREYGDWELVPEFSVGYNEDGQCIQNLEVEVIRTIGTQHAQIKTMTSFELELADKDHIPSNDQDFLEYASLQQMGIAHARAFFIRETKGTKFAGDLIPMDCFGPAFEKVKHSVINAIRNN
jgi:hypothetical protein